MSCEIVDLSVISRLLWNYRPSDKYSTVLFVLFGCSEKHRVMSGKDVSKIERLEGMKRFLFEAEGLLEAPSLYTTG